MTKTDWLMVGVTGIGVYLLLKGMQRAQFVRDLQSSITGTPQPTDTIKTVRNLTSPTGGGYSPIVEYTKSGQIKQPTAIISQFEPTSHLKIVPGTFAGKSANITYKFREGERGNLAQRMLDNLRFIPKQWIYG